MGVQVFCDLPPQHAAGLVEVCLDRLLLYSCVMRCDERRRAQDSRTCNNFVGFDEVFSLLLRCVTIHTVQQSQLCARGKDCQPPDSTK